MIGIRTTKGDFAVIYWPVGLILLDSVVAVAMWICIGRFLLSVALPDQSPFFAMRFYVFPLSFGYEVAGLGDFPLEDTLLHLIR